MGKRGPPPDPAEDRRPARWLRRGRRRVQRRRDGGRPGAERSPERLPRSFFARSIGSLGGDKDFGVLGESVNDVPSLLLCRR